jgi:hypothetical protein
VVENDWSVRNRSVRTGQENRPYRAKIFNIWELFVPGPSTIFRFQITGKMGRIWRRMGFVVMAFDRKMVWVVCWDANVTPGLEWRAASGSSATLRLWLREAATRKKWTTFWVTGIVTWKVWTMFWDDLCSISTLCIVEQSWGIFLMLNTLLVL